MIKRMLACLIALMLMLSAFAEDDNTIIATFDGGEVRFEEIYGDYEGIAAVYSALYGEDAGERADIALELTKRLVDELIKEKLLLNYADSQPESVITDAAREQIEAQALSDYQQLYEESLPMYLKDGDMTEEEAAAELVNDLAAEGLDYDSYLEEYTKDYKKSAALALLAGEVKVTSAQVKARYEEKLASDTQYFTESPEDYPYAYFHAEQTVLYIPQGLRQVRVYLIDMTDAEVQTLSATGKTDDIMAHAQSAEQIFGTAGGEAGAPVCANCGLFTTDIIAAAMALAKPGDISLPVKTDSGYIAVEYVSDIKSATIPLKTVYDELYAVLYSEAQQAQGEAKLEEMFENANVQYYLNRIN